MDLRNWEFFESGNPVVGAAVYARDAILTHPNAGTILDSTTTDANGMWAFTGLSNTPKDIEVVWGASSQYHKWYKGMTRHDVATVFFSEAPTLPAGSITSSHIVDGTIVDADINASAAIAKSKLALSNTIGTSDLVAGAVSQRVSSQFWPSSNQTFTTVSSYVDITGCSLSITPSSGSSIMIVSWSSLVQHSAANARVQLDVRNGGNTTVLFGGDEIMAVAATNRMIRMTQSSTATTLGWTSGALTLKLSITNYTVGTVTVQNNWSIIDVVEIKR